MCVTVCADHRGIIMSMRVILKLKPSEVVAQLPCIASISVLQSSMLHTFCLPRKSLPRGNLRQTRLEQGPSFRHTANGFHGFCASFCPASFQGMHRVQAMLPSLPPPLTFVTTQLDIPVQSWQRDKNPDHHLGTFRLWWPPGLIASQH